MGTERYFIAGYRREDKDSIWRGPFATYDEAVKTADQWFKSIPEEEWRDCSYDIIEED